MSRIPEPTSLAAFEDASTDGVAAPGAEEGGTGLRNLPDAPTSAAVLSLPVVFAADRQAEDASVQASEVEASEDSDAAEPERGAQHHVDPPALDQSEEPLRDAAEARTPEEYNEGAAEDHDRDRVESEGGAEDAVAVAGEQMAAEAYPNPPPPEEGDATVDWPAHAEADDPRQAAPDPVGSEAHGGPSDPAHGLASAAPPVPADPPPAGPPPAPQVTPPAAPSAGGPRTLTHAIDTAAKLAADANAAAQALDSLKRLLQQGLPPTARQQQPIFGIRPQRQLTPLPAKPLVKAATTPTPSYVRQLPAAPALTPEPMRFDLRGFLAGFALSWAIGVVLYLFMTAG